MLGQLVADREPHVAPHGSSQRDPCVAPAESARTKISRRLDVLGWDLLKRPVEHRHVISGGVRASVPRPQQAAERLAGLIHVDLQRVKPVATLVVPGRLLLLRMRGDQRRVNVERQPLRRTMQLPEPRPRLRVRDTQTRPAAPAQTRSGRSSETLSSQTPPPRTTRPAHGPHRGPRRTRRRRRASPRDRGSPGPGHDHDAAA